MTVFAVQTLGEIASGWKKKEELICMVKSLPQLLLPLIFISFTDRVTDCPDNTKQSFYCTSILSGSAQLPNLTSEDYGGESGQLSEWIIGTPLPALQELYLSRVSKSADKITLDPSHPANLLFWCFSTAWYDSVRHGSLRHVTAQFGSVCISTAV